MSAGHRVGLFVFGLALIGVAVVAAAPVVAWTLTALVLGLMFAFAGRLRTDLGELDKQRRKLKTQKQNMSRTAKARPGPYKKAVKRQNGSGSQRRAMSRPHSSAPKYWRKQPGPGK